MNALLLVAALAFAGASVKQTGGDVRVGGKAAKAGQALKKGDTVVARGEKSWAIVELADATLLKLRGNSHVTVKGDSEASLDLGSVFAKVFKPGFKLRAGSAVASVRGTEFFTAFGRKEDLWMCVNHGVVDLQNRKGKVDVKAGEGVLVPGGKPPTKPKPYGWTKDLNWNMDPESGSVEDATALDSAYSDLLDQDYR